MLSYEEEISEEGKEFMANKFIDIKYYFLFLKLRVSFEFLTPEVK